MREIAKRAMGVATETFKLAMPVLQGSNVIVIDDTARTTLAQWMQFNGQMKIGDDVINYGQFVYSGSITPQKTVAGGKLDKDTTTIPVIKTPNSQMGTYVKIDDEVIVMGERVLSWSYSLDLACTADPASPIVIKSGFAPTDLQGARLYAQIGDEWISYTSVLSANNKTTLTGVLRGQLGTTALPHGANDTILFPEQYVRCGRGALGTTAAPHEQPESTVTPVSVFWNLSNVTVDHAVTEPVHAFSNDDMFRLVVAHELGHVIGGRTHDDGEPNIMWDGDSLGSHLGDGMHSDVFTDDFLARINTR